MKVDLVEYAKGICGQMDELTRLMADAASKAVEAAPSASNNSVSNKLRARLSQMEVIVHDGFRHKQELLTLINECTQLLA